MMAAPATPKAPKLWTLKMNSLDGGPLYKGVQRALMEQLATGDLKPGQLIPSERQLATEYNVSIGTLRKAIDELVENRILIRQLPLRRNQLAGFQITRRQLLHQRALHAFVERAAVEAIHFESP